ncbi:MAG TPA: cytochrome c [Alphaproteobacteria bacterium]|nr:cytochrome c [Alphaproteobacteria bacterium]
MRAGRAVLAALLVVAGPCVAQAAGADPEDARAVALGKRVYAEQCARCHGAHLEGQPEWWKRKPDGRLPAPPHDVHGHTWRHPDSQLFAMVKNGMGAFAPPGYQSDMPAFGGVLTDDEIWAVLAFIKSTWPPNFRAFQAEVTRRAEKR